MILYRHTHAVQKSKQDKTKIKINEQRDTERSGKFKVFFNKNSPILSSALCYCTLSVCAKNRFKMFLLPLCVLHFLSSSSSTLTSAAMSFFSCLIHIAIASSIDLAHSRHYMHTTNKLNVTHGGKIGAHTLKATPCNQLVECECKWKIDR